MEEGDIIPKKVPTYLLHRPTQTPQAGLNVAQLIHGKNEKTASQPPSFPRIQKSTAINLDDEQQNMEVE